MKAHLLYVEDDETLGFVTKDHLELEGYEITHCADGKEALATVQSQTFDLCILDVMLPGIDGFELAQHIRQSNRAVPILFLTAKSLKEDRIQGLKIGGDDYITKPFSIEELLLKIEIFLRRHQISSDTSLDLIQLGNYQFHYSNLTLSDDQKEEKRLTQREADLLKYLYDNRNRVLKRAEILTAIWGEDDYFLGRSLDVFISRLRKYLGQDETLKIENIHGVGFEFRCVG